MQHKLTNIGCAGNYDATNRTLTIADISMYGQSKTRVIEFNENFQIIKDTHGAIVTTYEYDTLNRLTSAIRTINGVVDTAVTYTYNNDCITKICEANNRTFVQKTDSHMNIIFESVTYRDNAMSINNFKYNDSDNVVVDETIQMYKDEIISHEISHYDDNGKLIDIENIK